MLPLDPATLHLVARILLVCIFPFSALDKILHWNLALKQANSSWLPGGPVLLVLAILLETLGSACIVANWHTRPVALLFIAYNVSTAVLYHPFWTQGDFWSRGDSVARAHFWDFLKNLGLAGGFLLAALAAGGL